MHVFMEHARNCIAGFAFGSLMAIVLISTQETAAGSGYRGDLAASLQAASGTPEGDLCESGAAQISVNE